MIITLLCCDLLLYATLYYYEADFLIILMHILQHNTYIYYKIIDHLWKFVMLKYYKLVYGLEPYTGDFQFVARAIMMVRTCQRWGESSHPLVI